MSLWLGRNFPSSFHRLKSTAFWWKRNGFTGASCSRLSPTSDHYRALQSTHEALLNAVKDITGKDGPFIQWFGTGPVQPPKAR